MEELLKLLYTPLKLEMEKRKIYFVSLHGKGDADMTRVLEFLKNISNDHSIWREQKYRR